MRCKPRFAAEALIGVALLSEWPTVEIAVLIITIFHPRPLAPSHQSLGSRTENPIGWS
jgi:hypothetical protein